MKAIRTRDELEDAVRHRSGYIYNDFGGSDPKLCPLHAVHCTWVRRMLAVKPGQLSVKKVWSESLPDLLSWLREAGKPYSSCSFCNPLSDASADVRTSRRTSVASHSAAPDDEGDSYFVSGPSNDHVVEVWSASRIPFDPKGKMRDLREQIRSAIRRFRPSTPSLCYGLYVSPDRSFCDAENVLFYNVDGVGVFSGLFRLGVCFERAFADTPAPKEPLGFEPRHYHRYQLVSDAVWRYWRATATIGSSTALLPRGELSVHRVWWQLQQGRVQPVDDIEGAPHQFGLRMTTRNIALQSTATLKRLVDGVVAAFQAHDESQLHVCSSRLAALIGQDERAVSRALVDARNACLGVRRLLWPRSTGVQWNPADDQCVAATITVLPHNGAEEPQISAEVVAVSETASDASLARA